MSLTLLLDLDDTLLDNDIDRFLPVYLKALSKHLAARFPGDLLVRELLSATQQMILNTNPGLTLEEAFDRAFYPSLGTSKEAMREEIDTFYAQIFPSLQPLTSPRPEAVEMVKEAFRRGYRVVVATNPLFPTAAIQHRLAWAGLPVDEYPFALITTYEWMHFTKPNPAYYAEILAQLGWPEQPAVMVGNSLPDDILPAAQLGLPTYYLSGNGVPGDSNPLSGHGSLGGIMKWAGAIDGQTAASPANQPAALLAALRSTPAAIDTITRLMLGHCWSITPRPSEWSITEIVCHLRDVDREVNLPRFELVAREENAFLPGINTDLWAEERQYRQQDGPEAVKSFTAARTQLVALLETLPAGDWERNARHAIFGPSTITELAGFIATHDRTHIQQIYANLRS